MRSVIYGVGVSLDGYIARPDGAFDFLFMPKDFSMAEFFAGVDTANMGRKTYEVTKAMSGAPEAKSAPKITNYVFSRSLPAGEREGFIFVDQSPESLVASLREKKGKNIWLSGGGEMARDFLLADLVDEIHLGVVPVVIGAGLPAFPAGLPATQLRAPGKQDLLTRTDFSQIQTGPLIPNRVRRKLCQNESCP